MRNYRKVQNAQQLKGLKCATIERSKMRNNRKVRNAQQLKRQKCATTERPKMRDRNRYMCAIIIYRVSKKGTAQQKDAHMRKHY